MESRKFLILAGVLSISLRAFPRTSSPPPTDHPCEHDAAYHKLDFWLGRWDVVDAQDGSKGGENFIEKVLDGCAIVENWHELDPRGGDGKSLFYYQPVTNS